jgi:hypothetical protein
MHERRTDTPTQPLPAVGRRRRRIPLGHLAAVTASCWLTGAALFAVQGLPGAENAPHCVRGAVWVIACGCFLIGLGCLAWCAALALEHSTRVTAVDRRRALYDAGPLELAADRERYRHIAEQAAGLEEHPEQDRNVRALRAVGSELHNGSRTRYGA